MAKPVFGWSNKREGTVVVLDDGSVWQRIGALWQENAPLPNTERASTYAIDTIAKPYVDHGPF